ncbi:MAG TPA: molybdopterin-binding protein [Oscillospiraceae bacterium]|nr:molybdopterin-binding protein [Oscillospiraceae bacterium]
MKTIKVEDAIGMVLGHDITEIVPGEFKGVAFKKGHIIQESDIEKLLRIGKEHIYILELDENRLHENEAAEAIGKLVCGKGIYYTPPSEGKISIKPKHKGLVKINADLLDKLNNLGNMILATIHSNKVVEKDSLIGSYRIIPLVIDKDKIREAENILIEEGPIFELKSFKPMKTAVIVTGSEVYKGRIKDKFGPVVEKKVGDFDSEIIYKTITPDEPKIIRDEIIKSKNMGAELILVTGGMSVDPDDKTPGAIKLTGADIVTYGTPVLPGAMLLVSYLEGVPVLGLPGCVMFAKTTSFDLVLPRIFAREKIIREDIVKMGYGGQCLSCETCRFPDCHLGKR